MERLWEEFKLKASADARERLILWIPRSLRCKAREVEKADVALENRSPIDAEVAQQLAITADELHQISNQISFVSVVALDELLSVGSERRPARPGRHPGGQGRRGPGAVFESRR